MTHKNQIKNWQILLSLACALLLPSCGTSLFSGLDKKNSEDKIILYLEQNKPDDALKEIESQLAKTPDDPKLLSLKSAAIAQKYGIDTISLALQMAKSQSSPSSNQNEVTALFGVLPDASDERIAGLQQAVDILNGIDQKTDSDLFKLTMLNSSLMTLRIKKLDSDGSGNFTEAELLAMSSEEVLGIFNNLDGAIAATVGASTSGESSQDSLEAISAIKTKINQQPGSTDEERLRNYLQSQQAGG